MLCNSRNDKLLKYKLFIESKKIIFMELSLDSKIRLFCVCLDFIESLSTKLDSMFLESK
ncbi:hypothetical protein DCO58_01540 [Helicobacter saguini]|uniref:Uncharacterized protein n=1 Tax=Helicobacter saguini TaxID=1548018 RepID=A0A6B0HLD9_9HELI|nr:hypothetical protein [Helicobacter saguini]MWV62935.1 hypothetical protein [Helicobacter saguini]MWV66395.1 hypothetical protein [Helicobacter saguini]MWV68747.1 hypothetical protein [Helicobacter saguini]MWV71700.1 hypothetical protein [Helicobacter saguini]